MKIFISYRREDSIHITGRIYDRLVGRFGKKSVYKDVDSIPFGVDFRDHFEYALQECDLVLVVIGDKWLDIQGEDGKRRLDVVNDFVRLEIETALRRNIRVIPLFVGRLSSIPETKLPDSLKPLVYRNGLLIRSDPDFHKDVDRLIKDIESFESGILRSVSMAKKLAEQPEIEKGERATAKKTFTVYSGSRQSSVWKALGLHLVGGFGLVAVSKKLKRGWLYPAAFLWAVIAVLYFGFNEGYEWMFYESKVQIGVGIPFGIWLAGIIDIIVTFNKQRRLS